MNIILCFMAICLSSIMLSAIFSVDNTVYPIGHPNRHCITGDCDSIGQVNCYINESGHFEHKEEFPTFGKLQIQLKFECQYYIYCNWHIYISISYDPISWIKGFYKYYII